MFFRGTSCHLIIGATEQWQMVLWGSGTRHPSMSLPLEKAVLSRPILSMIPHLVECIGLLKPGAHLFSALLLSCLTTKAKLLVCESQETSWAVCSTRTQETAWPFHFRAPMHFLFFPKSSWEPVHVVVSRSREESVYIQSSLVLTLLGLFRPQFLELTSPRMLMDWRHQTLNIALELIL